MSNINWRQARPGDKVKLGMLMKWPGYENQVTDVDVSLDGPFVCFDIRGIDSYWKKLPAETRKSGLDSYKNGYLLSLDLKDYGDGLLWADPVKKPTVIISC